MKRLELRLKELLKMENIPLKKEIKRKAKEIPESNVIKKTNKLAAYLIGKGFESDLVWDLLRAGSKK